MATKTFWISFGSGNGASFSGLTPTLTLFQTGAGGTLVGPGITERITGSGAYQFDYDSSTLSIFFRCDGGASVSAANRYIEGALDPVDYVDQNLSALSASLSAQGSTLVAQGSTLVAIGVSLGIFSARVGLNTDVVGTTSIDPTTVFGFIKRNQEFHEGSANFVKGTGIWTVTSRGSTLLMTKTLTNTSAQSTKS